MNWGYLIAGVLMAAITCLHLVVGGRRYVRPLLACKALKPSPRYVHYYCWHLVSTMLAAMSVGFLWAALRADAWELGIISTALTLWAFGWSFGLRYATGRRPKELPQGYLFLVASIPALLGLVQSLGA